MPASRAQYGWKYNRPNIQKLYSTTEPSMTKCGDTKGGHKVQLMTPKMLRYKRGTQATAH